MENINSELDQRADQQTAHTLDNSTAQHSTAQHIDPKQAEAEAANATYKMVQGDGTIVWESANFYYTLPPRSMAIFAGPKSQNLQDINVLNPGKWIPIGLKPDIQVNLLKSYYQKNQPPKKETNLQLPTGVTQVRIGERNFLMLAVRLSITGKTSEDPVVLAEKMRKWNPLVREPFFSSNDINVYYKDPRTVQTQALPHNNYQRHAVGHQGNVGSLYEDRKMPQRTYPMETEEKAKIGDYDLPWNETVDVIDPNVYVDDAPYKHAVAKEKVEQAPGPYDGPLFRTFDLVIAAAGGKGNVIQGKNILHGGRAKLPNPAQNNTQAKPRGEQRPLESSKTTFKNINVLSKTYDKPYEPANNKPKGLQLTPEQVVQKYGNKGQILVAETEQQAQNIIKAARKGNNNQKAKGPVLCGGIDTKDPKGQIIFGQNFSKIDKDSQVKEAFELFKTNMHPLLQARLEYMEGTFHIKSDTKMGENKPDPRSKLVAGQPASHAEVVVLDKLLKAREQRTGQPVTEADLADFLLHNRNLEGTTAPNNVPPRCINCLYLTDGVIIIGND